MGSHGFNVVTVTSDAAAPNQRFYRLCELEEVSGDVVYKTKNLFRRGHDIYFICDVPHLLKWLETESVTRMLIGTAES